MASTVNTCNPFVIAGDREKASSGKTKRPTRKRKVITLEKKLSIISELSKALHQTRLCVMWKLRRIFSVITVTGALLLTLLLYTISMYSHSFCQVSWMQSLDYNFTSPNCKLLFAGDKDEVERVWQASHCDANPHQDSLSDTALLKKTQNCSWIQYEVTNNNFYNSDIEKAYPLAFALNIHDSALQVIRLLKIIYRPQNAYCVHADNKSSPAFKGIFDNIAKCLPNVFVPQEMINVTRGWHTIVDAQMICFKQLLSIHITYPWHHVITLCGKELPLRTNREMVEILKKLNGTSAVTSWINPENEQRFITNKWIITPHNDIAYTPEENEPVPFNLTIYKSLAYYALSMNFVSFLLTDGKVAIFRRFMEQTFIPEEHFIATVFRMPGAPGGYNKEYSNYIPRVVDAIWVLDAGWYTSTDMCSGLIIHEICVCSSSDLYRLDYQPHSLDPTKPQNVPDTLFHNKYFLEVDHVIIDCMEEELMRRNMEESRIDLKLSM